MSLTVTHAFTSPVADDPAASAAGEVTPTRWNANHTITGTADITIGSSAITGGTDKSVLFDKSGILGEDTTLTFDYTNKVLTSNVFNLVDTTSISSGVLRIGGGAFFHAYPGISSGNIFIADAGNFSTTGVNLVGLGEFALLSNTTGTGNVAIGVGTLQLNQDGIDNMAIGLQALNHNISGSNNVALGRTALFTNTGGDNMGIGSYALYANTSGSLNVAVGSFALTANTTHTSSVAIGSSALLNSDAEGNIGIGERAGKDVSSGSYNTFIGTFAGWGITTGSNNVVIGTNTYAGLPSGLTGAIIFATGDGIIQVDYNYTTANTWTFVNKIAVPGGANPFLTSTSTITGGATGNVPTLTAGPVTGNPTKWIPINDAGVTRYIPTW